MVVIAGAGALNFAVAAAVAAATTAAAAAVVAVAATAAAHAAAAAAKIEPNQRGNQKLFISLLPIISIEAINA